MEQKLNVCLVNNNNYLQNLVALSTFAVVVETFVVAFLLINVDAAARLPMLEEDAQLQRTLEDWLLKQRLQEDLEF